jgi:hypothetical protein
MDHTNGPWCMWVYFFLIPVIMNLNVMLLSWYLRRSAANTMLVALDDQKKKEDMEDAVLIESQ